MLSAETFRRDGDADADWETPFGHRDQLARVARHLVPHSFWTTITRSRRRVQPLGARNSAPLCFRVMCGRRVYPGRRRSGFVGNIAVSGIAWLLGAGAHAQTDEIQVYDADINTPGQFSLQLHSNYIPSDGGSR